MSATNNEDYRLLIVDDEAVVCSLLKDALEDEGYNVTTASCGTEALEKITLAPPDLLITDIRMPDIDGITLAEQARDVDPGIGVVFMTGYASLGSAKNAIKQGALDYVLKPFELSEMRQAIRNAVAKLAESAEASGTQKLTSLSDLSHMLFAVGDRKSLVRSSLKFAMMHLDSPRGSIVYFDTERDGYTMLTSAGDKYEERHSGKEPLHSLMSRQDIEKPIEPVIVTDPSEHPILRLAPNQGLEKLVCPPWRKEGTTMIVVPIMRAENFGGLLILEVEDDTVKLRQTDLKFLSITASQLAIMLENVALLEETQQAYARLKALQDVTIELEKMATRGEMSAEIGHELNNFLAVVAGNVELLGMHLQKKEYNKLNKYLDKVLTTLGKIKKFTANLMDLRAISSEKEVAPFDQIILEVVEYLQPQKRFRGVDIDVPDELDSAPFECDTTQIRQLLYNLFNNAADAVSECEERRITVNLDVSYENENFTVTIVDTGKGFDPKFLAKAFHEKFTTKVNGHGFGLVVCNRIVENHGGKLEVDSTPGKGTRISITFPLAAEFEAVSSSLDKSNLVHA